MNEQHVAAASALEARILTLKPGLDLLGLPACVLDRDLRYLYLNGAYATHTGRDPAEFYGRTPDEVFNLRPSDGRRRQLQRAPAGEVAIFSRITLEGPNTGRWVSA